MMFTDLARIVDFAFRLLHARGAAPGNWRTVFSLYLAIERVIDQAGTIATVLHPSSDNQTVGQQTRPRYLKIGNELFEALDEAVIEMVELMGQLCKYRLAEPVHHASLEQQFHCHFHPKSHWYLHFLSQNCCGRISPDGRWIERTVFQLHPAPTRRLLGIDLEELGLCQAELLDCASDQARAVLADQCQASLPAMEVACDALAQMLRSHCTLDSLLKPVPKPLVQGGPHESS